MEGELLYRTAMLKMLTRCRVSCLCLFLCCFNAKRECKALTDLLHHPNLTGVQQLQVTWSTIKPYSVNGDHLYQLKAVRR